MSRRERPLGYCDFSLKSCGNRPCCSRGPSGRFWFCCAPPPRGIGLRPQPRALFCRPVGPVPAVRTTNCAATGRPLPPRQIPGHRLDVSRHPVDVRGSVVTEASIGADTQTSSRWKPTSSRCPRICGDRSFRRARYRDMVPMEADIQPMSADLRRRKLPSGQIPGHGPEVSRHPADVCGSAATEASLRAIPPDMLDTLAPSGDVKAVTLEKRLRAGGFLRGRKRPIEVTTRRAGQFIENRSVIAKRRKRRESSAPEVLQVHSSKGTYGRAEGTKRGSGESAKAR